MRSLYFAIPFLLVSAALAGAGWRRWRFARSPDAFRCVVRACGAAPAFWPRLRRRWRRRRVWARWLDTTLVVERGLLLPRRVELPVRACEHDVRTVLPGELGRRDRRSIAVELVLSDGSQVEIGAARSARLTLVGPYVAAALHGLPRGPVPRRRDRRAGS
ncbi:MAG TPA: hypothetical protein VFR67_22895 [Pilimelia sp.]|nr:hypothetical protein [Pilimelia sp.]